MTGDLLFILYYGLVPLAVCIFAYVRIARGYSKRG
jgi:hypothetical protein